jgi:hypothetical protein
MWDHARSQCTVPCSWRNRGAVNNTRSNCVFLGYLRSGRRASLTCARYIHFAQLCRSMSPDCATIENGWTPSRSFRCSFASNRRKLEHQRATPACAAVPHQHAGAYTEGYRVCARYHPVAALALTEVGHRCLIICHVSTRPELQGKNSDCANRELLYCGLLFPSRPLSSSGQAAVQHRRDHHI